MEETEDGEVRRAISVSLEIKRFQEEINKVEVIEVSQLNDRDTDIWIREHQILERKVTIKCRKLTPFQRFRAPRIPDEEGKEHFFDGSLEDATR